MLPKCEIAERTHFSLLSSRQQTPYTLENEPTDAARISSLAATATAAHALTLQ